MVFKLIEEILALFEIQFMGKTCSCFRSPENDDSGLEEKLKKKNSHNNRSKTVSIYIKIKNTNIKTNQPYRS